MALTAQQKHEIKKKIATQTLEQIAADLGLPRKKVLDYLKKHLPEKKYRRLAEETDQKKEPPPHEKTDFDRKRFFVENANWFALFFILIFVVYLNAFDNAFVSDDKGIENNPLWSSGLSSFARFSSWGFFPYIILTELGLTSPFFFRTINLLLHFGSTSLLFSILTLFGKKNIAILTALLFAVHPLLTEAVGWISGRPYSQSGFFFLAAFWFYLFSAQARRAGKKALGASLVCFFLALITSEKAVALLAIFPLYELAFGNLKKQWKKLLPFLVLAGAFAFLNLSKTAQRLSDLEAIHYNETNGLYNPLVQIPIAVSSYLGLIFWPQKLSLYHSEMSFSIGLYLLSLLVFLAFLSLIYYSWKKNRFVFFWLSFFFISLLPTLTPLKVSWIVAERYVYIGTAGVLVALAYFFQWIVKRFPAQKNWCLTLFVVLLLILSVRTIVRNVDWDNEDNLWIATGKTAPSSSVNHNNLGDVYARRGEYATAVAEFQKAIELNPGYADAYHNLANTYQAMKKNDLAIEHYQKALELNPRLWQSHQNLAGIYFNQGDFQKAREQMQKAAELNPADEKLQENLKIIEEKLAQ